MGMVFQIDAVRKEFNAVSVDKDEALQKRLLRLERDRCSNYRKKVHNLQLELQHNCTGLGLKDPGRELEAVRFRSRMEAVQVALPQQHTLFRSPVIANIFLTTQSLLLALSEAVTNCVAFSCLQLWLMYCFVYCNV